MESANGNAAAYASKATDLQQIHSAVRQSVPEAPLDAGLRSLDHYRTRLPSWRYKPRQWLIPVVRWETPRLAALQQRLRSPALDTFFSLSANFGTHTFFMIFLPIMIWCGYAELARAFVHILASGVFFSGFLKDLMCLPRPLSPPLRRITMSHSVSLEYGFPSTHSTNAVSVATYVLFLLSRPSAPIQPNLKFLLQGLAFCYAAAIVLGRLYCGMHGFLDVTVGSALGLIISTMQFLVGDALDQSVLSGSFRSPLLVILTILVLVRIHPEPADDCPCFDDSVAFAGVVIGLDVGGWHLAHYASFIHASTPGAVPFDLERIGWLLAVIRVILGVHVILLWRAMMKPILLKILPPTFRVIQRLGLSLPRRFFIQASQYKEVSSNVEDDNVLPSVSELPALLKSLRHPRRNRSVSIGPQSEADAYEALAFRERQRRDSLKEKLESQPGSSDYFSPLNGASRRPVDALRSRGPNGNGSHIVSLDDAETALYIPTEPSQHKTGFDVSQGLQRQEAEIYNRERKDMFSKIEKPRVRYDVEVVTKLIVYAGIAWISAELMPVMFEMIGLGMS